MDDPSSQPPSQQYARDHNRRAWDALRARRNRFTRPAKDVQVHNPLAAVDVLGQLGRSIAGLRTLCLAAGGGRQSALYAAAGAKVTVVDVSPAMLALDREVAAERNLDIRTVEASMDDLSALATASFDVVIHPVSTCYLPNIAPVYQEVARVTVSGGTYISQHKSPVSLQVSEQPAASGRYEFEQPYYRHGPLPAVTGSRLREEGTLEFLHRWETLIGGLCRAGFVIEDLTEPMHADRRAGAGSFGHRSCYVAPYIRIKARRVASNKDESPSKPQMWLP